MDWRWDMHRRWDKHRNECMRGARNACAAARGSLTRGMHARRGAREDADEDEDEARTRKMVMATKQ
jgi:hypothetical protein